MSPLQAISVHQVARTLGVESGWALSNLTIQKTLYIVQMIHLGRTGMPAFAEQFEAWDYGPVVPPLYRTAKKFGAAPVQDIFNVELLDPVSSQAQAVRDTFATTRHMTAGQLVTYTHRVGGAWEAYYREGCRGIVIPTEAILQEWKACTTPSRDALAWAETMADEVEETPGRYLDRTDERAFRARLLGQNIH